jgi:hypothetical protein
VEGNDALVDRLEDATSVTDLRWVISRCFKVCAEFPAVRRRAGGHELLETACATLKSIADGLDLSTSATAKLWALSALEQLVQQAQSSLTPETMLMSAVMTTKELDLADEHDSQRKFELEREHSFEDSESGRGVGSSERDSASAACIDTAKDSEPARPATEPKAEKVGQESVPALPTMMVLPSVQMLAGVMGGGSSRISSKARNRPSTARSCPKLCERAAGTKTDRAMTNSVKVSEPKADCTTNSLVAASCRATPPAKKPIARRPALKQISGQSALTNFFAPQ